MQIDEFKEIYLKIKTKKKAKLKVTDFKGDVEIGVFDTFIQALDNEPERDEIVVDKGILVGIYLDDIKEIIILD